MKYRKATAEDVEFIREFQVKFEQTGNPIYIWHAIRRCCGYNSKQIMKIVKDSTNNWDKHWQPLPLPEWCVKYLWAVSNEIWDLQYDNGKIYDNVGKMVIDRGPQRSSQRKIELLPAALGFVRKGQNAFLSLSRTYWDDEILSDFEIMIEDGMSAAAAEGVIADRYGVTEVTTVRRWLTRARKNRKALYDCELKRTPRKT